MTYLQTKDDAERQHVQEWLARLEHSRRAYADYFDLVDQTRAAYKADQGSDFSAVYPSAYNIFWSGVETQKPFLYFKRPQPWIERVNKIATPVEQAACKILERALAWNLTQFDFDSVAKYARNDYLISGMGILFESFTPSFREMADADGCVREVVDKEVVATRYWDPRFLLIDTDKVGVWEDVRWIARSQFLTRDEALDLFGEAVMNAICLPREHGALQDKSFCVYEIWDKPSRMIYWVSPACPDRFLKVMADPFRLENFFPCPKPIFATLANDSLIPVPDYAMVRRMTDELNGITERMRLIMQAIKVSGVYDGSFRRLSDIFEKDVTLVALSDFDKLKASGGIRGVIDFIPIEQYVTALEQLARRRDDVVKRIFEITGVSDIMRGNSSERETATAVEKKTNFGTLRNQDRQNDMQRFLTDLYRIKAEMICACFSEENLARFIGPNEGYAPCVILAAVRLLKSEKLRGMILHVETDGVLNEAVQSARTVQGIQMITSLLKDAFVMVSQEPLLLPLFQQMILAVVGQMPHARSFESIISQTFNAIQNRLAEQKEAEKAKTGTLQAELAQRAELTRAAKEQLRFNRLLSLERFHRNYALEKEKNRLKGQELALKTYNAVQKNRLANQAFALDVATKQAKVVQDQTRSHPVA